MSLDWLQALKVGDRVCIERRWRAGRLDHAHTATVIRRTPKRAYIGHQYIDLSTGLVRPQYLDYTTRAVALTEPAPDTDITGDTTP